METGIDLIQKIILRKRNVPKLIKDEAFYETAEEHIRININLSKQYLANATGEFKLHLEKMIKVSERILYQLSHRKK
jgi:hypothetical protein